MGTVLHILLMAGGAAGWWYAGYQRGQIVLTKRLTTELERIPTTGLTAAELARALMQAVRRTHRIPREEAHADRV